MKTRCDICRDECFVPRGYAGGPIVCPECPALPQVYRTADAAPEAPAGMALYAASLTSGVPDDDGRHGYRVWFFAPNDAEAQAMMEAYVEYVAEGGEVVDVEREEVLP